MKTLSFLFVLISTVALFSCQNIDNKISKKQRSKNKIDANVDKAVAKDTVKLHLKEIILTSENIEKLIKTKDAKFISFGISRQNFDKFQEKYGIGLQSNGCVITGNMGSNATKNNQFLAKYLTEKYGEDWKKDLPFIPFGLETI